MDARPAAPVTGRFWAAGHCGVRRWRSTPPSEPSPCHGYVDGACAFRRSAILRLKNCSRRKQICERRGAFAVPAAVHVRRAEMALEGGDRLVQRNLRVRRNAIAETGEILRR